MYFKRLQSIFFTLWVMIIRIACLLFVILQSYSVGISFTIYCLAVLSTLRPALRLSKPFNSYGSDSIKKLLVWSLFVAITSCTAYILGLIVNEKEVASAVRGYLVIATETTVLLYLTQLMVIGVAYLANRSERKQNKWNTELNKRLNKK